MHILKRLFARARALLGFLRPKARTFATPALWLNSLPHWDGVPRLDTWLVDYAGAKDSEGNRLIARYLILGLVARALEPGCKFDYCLLLSGPQGSGKSGLLRALAGPWFGDLQDFESGSAIRAMADKWLCEISELGRMTQAEAGRLKSFLTRRQDVVKLPYCKEAHRFPRRTVFAMTSGDWNALHLTEGRRYWPVEIHDADTAGLLAIREQLFAEALDRYYFDARYLPTEAEEQTITRDAMPVRGDDDIFPRLAKWVLARRTPFSIDDAMTAIGRSDRAPTRVEQTRVGMALRRLGCRQVDQRDVVHLHAPRRLYNPPSIASAQAASPTV